MKLRNYIKNLFLSLSVAAGSIICSIQSTCAKSLFESGDGASQNAITSFTTTYQHWFFLGFIVSLLAYYLVRDEKMKGYLQKVAIGLLVVFILSIDGVQDVITATLNTIAGWFTQA